jgi:hypothetical protein
MSEREPPLGLVENGTLVLLGLTWCSVGDVAGEARLGLSEENRELGR